MAIQPATRLGPYKVLSAMGAGGVGKAYKTRDTPLDRIVAIKVVPQHLADKSKLRFEREIRTSASLNHPRVCTLHGVGQQNGTNFLLMEYVETMATHWR
jgi:eukaryotic-like serine/threonine-protein kinase